MVRVRTMGRCCPIRIAFIVCLALALIFTVAAFFSPSWVLFSKDGKTIHRDGILMNQTDSQTHYHNLINDSMPDQYKATVGLIAITMFITLLILFLSVFLFFEFDGNRYAPTGVTLAVTILTLIMYSCSLGAFSIFLSFFHQRIMLPQVTAGWSTYFYATAVFLQFVATVLSLLMLVSVSRSIAPSDYDDDDERHGHRYRRHHHGGGGRHGGHSGAGKAAEFSGR